MKAAATIVVIVVIGVGKSETKTSFKRSLATLVALRIAIVVSAATVRAYSAAVISVISIIKHICNQAFLKILIFGAFSKPSISVYEKTTIRLLYDGTKLTVPS